MNESGTTRIEEGFSFLNKEAFFIHIQTHCTIIAETGVWSVIAAAASSASSAAAAG